MASTGGAMAFLYTSRDSFPRRRFLGQGFTLAPHIGLSAKVQHSSVTNKPLIVPRTDQDRQTVPEALSILPTPMPELSSAADGFDEKGASRHEPL